MLEAGPGGIKRSFSEKTSAVQRETGLDFFPYVATGWVKKRALSRGEDFPQEKVTF